MLRFNMQSLGWLAVALRVLQVTCLPVASEISEEDTKVMKCVVEVISDTLSKPSPLPISPKCLETLRGDDRIISILRRNNLLKELQQLAAQGAIEKGQQEKKSSDFRDELSKALLHEEDKESARENIKEISPEDSAAASHEAQEGSNKESGKNSSEEEKNSMEKKEPSEHVTASDEEEDKNKGAYEALESNEIGDNDEAVRADSIDNHITDEINAEDLSEEKHQKPEFQTKDASESHESHELNEEKQPKSKLQKEGIKDYSTDDHEDVRSPSEGKTLSGTNDKSSQEDTADETQGNHGRSEEAPDPEKDMKTFESDDKSHEDSEEIHSLGNGMTSEDDAAHTKETRSGEAGESSSKELEDSKRWNKMDELAKELTSKKRMAETKSKEDEEEEEEDPDRSMKIPYRARKYNFDSRERDVKRSWKHHSSEDSSERAVEPAIRPNPEEKKEEEGSANRRTEDRELESLSAIEAELEKVAHKLIELRKG